MKQNQKILLGIGLGVVILFNVLLLGGLLTDFFSGPNGPGETVAATDSGEETTGEETTVGEAITSQEETTEEQATEELTTEESTPEETIGERIEVEIPFAEIQKVAIHSFGWGNFKTELGYTESDIFGSFYPTGFIVGERMICVLDNVNSRILIQYKGKYREIPLNKLYTASAGIRMWQLDGWITFWNFTEDKLMLYWLESGAEIHLDLSAVVKASQGISRFLEIGSSYVVWAEPSGDKEAVYRYDWIENKVSLVTLQEKNIPADTLEGISPFIIGTYEDEIYYCQYGENLDRYILNCVTPNYHLRTEIEFAPYRTAPKMYLSPDGHLYIMEMFEDRAEISEINLTPEMVK